MVKIMAAIFYQFALNEIEMRDGLIINEYIENLPHHQEVADTVKRIWDMCHIETTFDGILEGKIDSCYLRIFTNKKGQTVARIQICLNDGERWSEKKRNECWEQLDAQMADGFGESIEYHRIDGVSDAYRIQLGTFVL